MPENIENEKLDNDVNEENTAAETEISAEGTTDKTDETDKQSDNSKGIFSDVADVLESTFITVFMIVMIFTYILHPVNVVGHSMENTLFDKDRIFMTTVYAGISYGDIVIINNDAAYLLDENNNVIRKDITNSRLNECIIKRVIAEPGQSISIDSETGEVSIDGKVIDEPYIKELARSGGVFKYPITVPEGYYFVMGDNRNNSSDSRDGDVGFIKKDQIFGKALVRYAPLKNFKFLTFSK